jgi:acyl-CoA reductase-like NAD-dependent aldehyde dehydrogenase
VDFDLVTAHHGQLCFGTERIIVHEKVKDEFTKELIEAMRKHSDAGHASSPESAKKGHDIISEAVQDGAQFLYGSCELTTETSLTPSILINLNPKSRLNREESFAPSASVYVVKTDEEAIERGNETDFGLSASLWTKDYKKALTLARELEFGQVQINGLTIYADGEPFSA